MADTFQLARTVSQDQNCRSQKARLGHSGTVLELRVWMDQSLLSFSRWCSVYSGFHGLNGTLIMASAGLRSGACIKPPPFPPVRKLITEGGRVLRLPSILSQDAQSHLRRRVYYLFGARLVNNLSSGTARATRRDLVLKQTDKKLAGILLNGLNCSHQSV